MGFVLANVIRERAADRGSAPCITFNDRTISFTDLDERSSRVAQALIAAGVKPQERVAFLDKNGPEFFEVLFGCAKANAVIVPVNWRLAPPEMAHIINDSRAPVLIVGDEFESHLDAIENDLSSVKQIVVIGKHDRHPTYEEWVGATSAEDPHVESGPDDVAMQLYTSGTTGLPKGVMLVNSNLDNLVPTATEVWKFTPDAVNFVVMPLFHIAGSGWGLVGITMGCHTVMHREIDPAAILEAIPRYGITHALFVPAVLQFLLMTPGCNDHDYSTLRMVVYGASPISEQVLRQSIETFGCEFVQAYGMTETSGGIVLLRAEDHDPGGPRAHLLRSCGRPLDWVELRCVDPATGEDVPTGEVGEVWTRSAQNMKGYWDKPEETEATILPDGWLRTGDAGYLDDEGYLFLHDRVKDMIITGGENVYPAEIENCLMAHPGIADVAAIGVPHEKWGETVKAIVVKAEGADVSDDDIIAFARERLAHFKCPTSVDWVSELPRNPSGKILKRQLRDPYWEGRERQVN